MNIYGITETHTINGKFVGERNLSVFYESRYSARRNGLDAIKRLREIEGFTMKPYDGDSRMELTNGETTFVYNIHLYKLLED